MSARWLAVLPAGVSFVLVGAVVALSGQLDWAVGLFLGVIAGGLVDVDHRLLGRFRYMLGVTLLFAVVSVAVEWSARSSWALMGVMTLLAFVMTFLGAVDGRYRTVAFGGLVVALYTLLIYQDELAWFVSPALIVAGALGYQLVGLVVHALMPNRPVQADLVALFEALSAFMAVKASFFNPDEVVEIGALQAQLARKNGALVAVMNRCRVSLFRRLGHERVRLRTRRQLQEYWLAQEMHERVNSSHVDYQRLARDWGDCDVLFRIGGLIALQSRVCGQFARVLEGEAQADFSARLERALVGLRLALARQQERPNALVVGQIVENLAQVNGLLEALLQGVEVKAARRAQIMADEVNGWRAVVGLLGRNLTLRSRDCRHALRMALLTLGISGVVEGLDLPLGYWILLTAVFVMRPNYVATQARLRHRIVGTFLGVVLAWALEGIGLNAGGLIVLMVGANVGFFYTLNVNYRLATLLITLQALLGFMLLGMHVEATLFLRLVYTALGAGAAWMAVSWLFPDWRYWSAREAVDKAIFEAGQYLQAIVAEFSGISEGDAQYRLARRRAHEQVSQFALVVEEMAALPRRYGRQLPWAEAVLAQLSRVLSELSALGAARAVVQGFSEKERALCVSYAYRLVGQLSALSQRERVQKIEEGVFLGDKGAVVALQFERLVGSVGELQGLIVCEDG